MAKNILIVDDEPTLVKGLRFNLEQQEGYAIDVAYDGEEALEIFDPNKHDLILLDLMLPKIDGMEVCQKIRSMSEVPIIMLTAKGEDMDKIMGLEFGADDYMTKPFNMLELKARIKTILRRAGAQKQVGDTQTIVVKDMKVNLINRSVEIKGEDINLTAKEFDLLNLFITIVERCLTEIPYWSSYGNIRAICVRWTCISAVCAKKSSKTRQNRNIF